MQQNIPTKDYQIQLSDSAGESFDQWMTDKSYSSIYVFMDENVMEKCWPVLHNDSEVLKSAEIIVIEAGEDQKDIEMAAQLWQTLMEYQADRKSLWINFGGGMISDLGGFVASTFKRGMDFINIPTTILSMVDASVGGKTAINMGSYKNQIGMFSSPKAIFMQANFIDSLSPKHQLSGWSEMLKHALIADKSHWTQLIKIKSLDSENLSPILADSIRIKKNIVEEDPLEKGNRKKLNFFLHYWTCHRSLVITS